MWFHSRFKEINGGRSFRCRCYFFTASIVQFGHLAYERNHITQELHKSTHTHVFACAHAEYGENAARYKTFANAFTQFVFGKCFAFEELLHQSFVVLGCCLNQYFIQSRSLFHFFSRNVFHLWRASLSVPRIFFHGKHVDDGIKAWSCLCRILNLHTFLAIDILHGRDDVIEVALLRIQLIDKEDNRFLEFFRVSEIVLCSHFGTILPVNQDNSLVCNVQRGYCSAHKIICSGTVDDVQLFVVPLYMEYCREDRVAIFLFNGEIITHRVLCFHRATALDYTTTKKHCLGKSGLAGTRTAH